MNFMSINSVPGINLIPLTLLSICIGWFAYEVVTVLYFSRLAEIPGPFLARFTALWELFNTAAGKDHEWYVNLHEQYGPVVRVAPNRFSLSSVQYIHTIYNGILEKSEYYDAFGDPENPNPWSVRDKRQQELRRGGFAHMYSLASIKHYEEVVDRKIELMRAELATAARDDSPCPITGLLKLFVFDATAQITFGKDCDTLGSLYDDTGLIDATARAFWYSSLLGHLPKLHRLLLRITRIFGYKLPVIRLLDGVRRLRPGRGEAGELSDSFLRRLFILLDEDSINRQVIEDCCFSNVGFGIGKMSIALSAALYYIYQHPHVLKKLRQELDDYAARHLSNPDKLRNDLNLPYLQAVLYESLRIHPVIGTMLPRAVPQGGMKLGGYYFPEGTVIGVNPWTAHGNKEAYGNDVRDFRPERWLEGDTATHGLFAFGAGSRACPGENMSLMIMRKLIAELVREFDVIFSSTEGPPNIYTAWFVWMEYECLVRCRNRTESDSM